MYKGKIVNWEKVASDSFGGLGFFVTGILTEHPNFSGMKVHTKNVLEWTDHNDGTVTIQTKNARYMLEKQ